MNKPNDKQIHTAHIRHYPDSGDTKAIIDWQDGSSTTGDPDNEHMKALLARAEREGKLMPNWRLLFQQAQNDIDNEKAKPAEQPQDTITEVGEQVWTVLENAMNRAADYRVQRDEWRASAAGYGADAEEAKNELIIARQQRDELLAALREAKSLIQGYRAGWDKEVTARVLAPIDAAIARAEGLTHE